jgi:hypothetical protein
MNRVLIAAAVGAFAVQGCGGGGAGVYPDTDVVELSGFELKLATGVQKSGGLLQTGTLEYVGAGDLVAVYRAYVDAMKARGWVGANDEITGDKAIGTLRKDNRSCALTFTSAQGQIRASIKVAQTK